MTKKELLTRLRTTRAAYGAAITTLNLACLIGGLPKDVEAATVDRDEAEAAYRGALAAVRTCGVERHPGTEERAVARAMSNALNTAAGSVR